MLRVLKLINDGDIFLCRLLVNECWWAEQRGKGVYLVPFERVEG